MFLVKKIAQQLSPMAIGLLLIALALPIAGMSQTTGTNDYLTVVVEFENALQRIYVTEQNQKAKKIAVLSPLKEANNIAKNIRLKEEEEFKEKGYTIKRKKLSSKFDFSAIYEMINEYEAAGWTLNHQNMSTGGALKHNEYLGKATAFYSFSKPKGQ